MSKIMLVDDNEVIIDLYERTINEIPSAEVVAVAKNGDLLVSDWGTDLQGVIYRIDSKGQVSTIKIESMGGPADMYSDGVSLWIPRMVDKKVSKIDLP